MQSGNGDPFVPINHRIEIEWLRYINLRRISNFPETNKSLQMRPLKATIMSAVLLKMRILDTYDSRTAENEQYSIQDAFKNHGTDYSRRGPHTVRHYCNEYGRP